MTEFQRIILATMPWELLFIVLPMVCVYVLLILKEKKKKRLRRNFPVRRHFFS